MSAKIMHTELDRILTASEPKVISIRGRWGIGKTYAWKNYLHKRRRDNGLRAKRYSYVSLFGIDSLDELKFFIFQQFVESDSIGQKVSMRSFGKNAKRLYSSMGRKWSGSVLNIPYLKNFELAAKSIAFLSTNDSLICFDDLERRGQNLAIRDVLERWPRKIGQRYKWNPSLI